MDLKERLPLLCLAALLLGIYCYPAIRTMVSTRSCAVPPSLAADTSLYLNLSASSERISGQPTDPFYGISIRTPQLGYLRFRTAFLLFGALSYFVHGNLAWTLLFWNLFWWLVLCVLAAAFFQSFLPGRSTLVVAAGLAVLMLFNFGTWRTQINAWIQLPSLRDFHEVGLPYIRPFFPQLPIPLTLLYLFLQARALQSNNWRNWALMALTQFSAFTIFPYSTLVMAGITALCTIGIGVAGKISATWDRLALYFLACSASDLVFLLHGDHPSRTGAPTGAPLIQLQLSLLPHRIRGAWLMLAALTALTFLVRMEWHIKWPLLGIGCSNLFLLVGDVFFSEAALQMSHHAGYFVHVTATILFVFLLSEGLAHLKHRERECRIALVGAIVVLVLNGILVAHATYQWSLPDNQEHAELARALRVHPAAASDLVIARATSVDDDCAWIPLLSPSHVLFCRNAQVLFTPEQNQQIQRFRQALYLHFSGKDPHWVENVLTDPAAEADLARLTFLGELSSAQERKRGIDLVRSELIPLLKEVEDNDVAVKTFFSQYGRILVIDNAANPLFDTSRLSSYLVIERRETSGQMVILTCRRQSLTNLHEPYKPSRGNDSQP